ncbi:uncharacterized protein LOC141655300 [Silene latifolia]|uniref:uncharacterized protein LOC141655300 n=1 Tax=Silene latifolia TaxID=37657 RepID=UPI003D77BA9F
MELEFIALELAGREAEWLRSLVADIPLWPKPVPSVPLHFDSQSAIHVAKNKAYNGKSRHIRLRHNIVCTLIKFGVISLDYVRSESCSATMSRAQPLRILLPFPNKLDLFNHYHSISPYIKAALYSSVTLSGTRFFTDLAEKAPEVVKEESRAQTPHDVLKKWGCDDTHNSKIFKRIPSIHNGDASNLESKLNLQRNLGVTSSGLVKIVYNRPRIMHSRSNENFDERLDQPKYLFGSEQLLVNAIVRNPSLLVYKFHEEIEPVFALYEEIGVSRSDLIYMLQLWPTLITRTKTCEEKLEYIRRTGVTKESKMLKYVVTIIGTSRIATINEKIANLEKFGIHEDQVLLSFGCQPLLMTLYVDKIQRNTAFVMDTMKLPASTVLVYPFLLTCNLENSLGPWVLLAGKIHDMGLEPQIRGPVMFRALRMKEKMFSKVFVNCHEKDVRLQLLAYYKACQDIMQLERQLINHTYFGLFIAAGATYGVVFKSDMAYPMEIINLLCTVLCCPVPDVEALVLEGAGTTK